MSLFQISRPDPGQTLTLHPAASDKITLGFPIEGVTLSRDDNALIFSFNDGAVIRLDDFYVDYRADFIPEFEVDGRLMSGTNFFTSFGPDLMPGAVPEHETRNAHVIQTDGDSSLMGGLDHLNGLDASAQEKSSAADGGIQFDSALAVGHGPADHGSGAPEPELPPLPVWPFMRVVFYYPGDPGDADAKISIPMYYKYYYGGAQSINPEEQYYTTSGEHGNMYAFTVSMPEGWSASWVDFNIGTGYGDTQISLTPEGAAELRRLGLTGKNLEGRIHVKVTNQVSGGTFEYDVQLVTTTSQNFDSVEYDRQSVGHHLENVGEFHLGQNNSGVYSIISSSQDDRIDLSDEVRGGSSIYASGSADRAHMANDRNSIIVDGINNSTPGTITHITSADGWLGTGYIYAYESGTENVIDMGKGRIETYLSGARPTGTFKAWGGKNIISGGDVDIRAFVTALDTIGGTNDITSSGGVTVDVTNDVYADIDGPHESAAIKATGQHGNNSIKTDSGYVTVVDTLSGGNFSHNYGIHSAYNGSNSITTKSGHVIVDIDMNTVGNNFGRGYGIGVHSVDNSNNNITTDSGDVTVTGNSNGIDNQGVGSGMTATIDDPRSGQVTSPDSGNTITTNSGSVAFTGTCTGTGSAYGIQVDGSGTNRIITKSGEVTVTGEDAGNSAKGYGMSAYGRSNCSNMITTDSGSVTVIGKGSVIGAGIDCGGYYKCTNIITTGSGAVTVSGTSTTDGRGMNVAEGYNTITTNSGEVKVSGSGADSGRGMSAESQGVNTIESTAGSPLTVTITASADTAEKAIAMWAKGEHVGGVNSITGHSQVGGTGDSVTLTANDGQGIAMLTGYLGKNIITTGAGDDSVTINGAVTSLDPKPGSGPGNEIDLGGGNNTLTLNGAVEAGGLKVSSVGGTYTLVLQAPDAESFVARYGDWITAIGADPLIADGLRGISFVGLNSADLPADFMTTFEGVLEAIYTRAGADAIVPPELIDLLPGHDSGFAVSFAETDAEHQMQDAQHAAAGHDASTQDAQHAAAQHAAAGHDASTQDVQHAAAGHTDSTMQDAQHAAAGHDASTQDVQHAAAGHTDSTMQDAQHAAVGHDASTQETPPAAHDGSVHMAGDDSQVAAAAASVQPDTAALHADILVPDDIAQPGLVAEHAVETAQPLFAFLNAPGAGAHVDTSAYEGDALLHNDHLGSGESQSGIAGVQGEITLTLGDESLDSLFAGTGQHQAENGEHGLWYVASGSDLHEVALTDISAIIVQGSPGEHVSDVSVTIEEYTYFEHAVVSAPSVMDFNQEATDNAVREMANY